MPAGEASCNGTSPAPSGHWQPVIAPPHRQERSAGTDHPAPRRDSRIPHSAPLQPGAGLAENERAKTPPCVSPLEVPCSSFPASAPLTTPMTASVTTRRSTGIPCEMSVPSPPLRMRTSTTSCVARGPWRRTRRCRPRPGQSPAVRPCRRPLPRPARRASRCPPQRPKRLSGRSPAQRPKRLSGQARPHRPKRQASRGLALCTSSRCRRPAHWPRLLPTSTARRDAEMARDPTAVVPAADGPGTSK